jgi:hypothetical protein
MKNLQFISNQLILERLLYHQNRLDDKKKYIEHLAGAVVVEILW